MSGQFVVFVTVLLLTAGICATLAVVVNRRWGTPGQTAFALMLWGAAAWALSDALEALAQDIPSKVLWSKFEYLGAATVGTFFFIFAAQYSHWDKWLTRRAVLLLSIMPALTLVIAFTNEWHGWFWNSFVFADPSIDRILIYGHATWFWVNVAYNYLMAFLGAVLLVQFVLRSAELYRLQTAAVLMGALAPLVGSAMYAFGLSPLPGWDLSPIPFVLTGLLFGWGMFRYRLLDLVPVARDVLIEQMSEGVIVLDAQDRIVDINPVAQHLIGQPDGTLIGKPIGAFLAAQPEFAAHAHDSGETHIEIAWNQPGAPRHLDLRVLPLHGWPARVTGRLIVWRDITARKKTEVALQQANERLQQQLVEIESLHADLREQATRDSLTGLYNRRYLDETLDRELARGRREGVPISLVMMDIDQFKVLNDNCGHAAGDLILQALGQWLRTHIRREDMAYRYGGEEFIVILPGASVKVAQERAEQWRQGLKELNVTFAAGVLATTVSFGIAVFPDHGKTSSELLKAADRALYAAKAAGRDCVRVWEDRADGKP